LAELNKLFSRLPKNRTEIIARAGTREQTVQKPYRRAPSERIKGAHFEADRSGLLSNTVVSQGDSSDFVVLKQDGTSLHQR